MDGSADTAPAFLCSPQIGSVNGIINDSRISNQYEHTQGVKTSQEVEINTEVGGDIIDTVKEVRHMV